MQNNQGRGKGKPNSLRRRSNARNVSFRISLRWPIYIINSVDKTKLSCNTPTSSIVVGGSSAFFSIGFCAGNFVLVILR